MRKYWMTALAVALGALLIGSSPASASAPCGYAFSALDWGTEVVPSVNSSVTEDAIVLVKVDGAMSTDASTSNLGTTGTTLTVDYELSGGATTDAGAIRFFAYDHADANTATVAPTYGPAIADAMSGTLTLDIAGGTIGTVGVTYDASNVSTGTVTFTNLMLDGEQLAFISECPEPTPTATESPTATASPTSSASPTPGATEEPSTAPSTEAEPELPVTGSNLPVALGGAAVLLGLTGGGLMALARRRRTTFRAE